MRSDYFQNNIKIFFIFHCVDIYTDDAKATVGKTARASAQTKVSAVECAGCVPAPLPSVHRKTPEPAALENILH